MAEVNSADQQRLTEASDRVDIRSQGAKPFQLDADFTAQTNVPQDGHFTLKWVNKNLWSQEITIGGYRQLNIRKGDILYISRNGRFTPLRVKELLDLLDVFSAESDSWQIKKIKQQARDGVEAECMEIRARTGRHGSNTKTTLCINPATKEVLTEEAKDETEYTRKEFINYQPFREHSYPQQLRLSINGSMVLQVKISSLRESSFDDSGFVPPRGAIARRQCEHMTYPVAIKQPDPTYPRSASQNGIGGTSIVALTVLPDGSVDDVQLIGRAGHEMDQVTQEIVKTWKFKPAMCGNDPVAYDITVQVAFRPQ